MLSWCYVLSVCSMINNIITQSLLFREVTCSASQNKLHQSSLDDISKWCDENAMYFNVAKCLVLYVL